MKLGVKGIFASCSSSATAEIECPVDALPRHDSWAALADGTTKNSLHHPQLPKRPELPTHTPSDRPPPTPALHRPELPPKHTDSGTVQDPVSPHSVVVHHSLEMPQPGKGTEPLVRPPPAHLHAPPSVHTSSDKQQLQTAEDHVAVDATVSPVQKLVQRLQGYRPKTKPVHPAHAVKSGKTREQLGEELQVRPPRFSLCSATQLSVFVLPDPLQSHPRSGVKFWVRF